MGTILGDDPLWAVSESHNWGLADPAPIKPDPQTDKPRVYLDGRELVVTSLPRETSEYIICGNCAGDDRLPLKTLMTADGFCSTCGGTSFELAATVAVRKQVLEFMKRSESV